ncbi:hypothetical protein GH714_002832 [Hevea brasiliensis]|uniref:Retroviral polymerase SH3-like domain-containing protein n=1 Tax=Hevea brasiliensis TaxID=3981 RepID=A0A6A6MWM6_HEVBR|nr:hypothetical protein GH714_002832 [Hevea brasiliensis]
MGNGGLSQVVGIEGVCLDTGNGMKVMLKDVKNALNVHLKFISAGRLDDKGYLNIISEGEALYTVAYVINLSSNLPLQNEVLDKIWFAKDVSYDHLHVFGFKAFVHAPKDERSKLYSKKWQSIFLAYAQDEFRYRLYDPIEKKLVKSRDVVFFEDQTIEDIEKVESQTP